MSIDYEAITFYVADQSQSKKAEYLIVDTDTASAAVCRYDGTKATLVFEKASKSSSVCETAWINALCENSGVGEDIAGQLLHSSEANSIMWKYFQDGRGRNGVVYGDVTCEHIQAAFGCVEESLGKVLENLLESFEEYDVDEFSMGIIVIGNIANCSSVIYFIRSVLSGSPFFEDERFVNSEQFPTKEQMIQMGQQKLHSKHQVGKTVELMLLGPEGNQYQKIVLAEGQQSSLELDNSPFCGPILVSGQDKLRVRVNGTTLEYRHGLNCDLALIEAACRTHGDTVALVVRRVDNHDQSMTIKL